MDRENNDHQHSPGRQREKRAEPVLNVMLPQVWHSPSLALVTPTQSRYSGNPRNPLCSAVRKDETITVRKRVAFFLPAPFIHVGGLSTAMKLFHTENGKKRNYKIDFMNLDKNMFLTEI